MNKPILIFDGDCGFCRVWIERWKHLTGDRVDYAPSQAVGKNFPDIRPEAFQKAVQLVEPDGRRSAAAEAVFRTMTYAGHSVWIRAYEKVPGFAAFSEFFYDIVAGHRPTFSALTRWLWDGTIEGSCGLGEPSSYRHVRWLFLRSLAVIYGIAFASFGSQVRGLIGQGGILPVQKLLEQGWQFPSVLRFWYVPTLAWFNSSDVFLVGMCVVGVVCSVLIFLNVAPRLNLFLAWLLFLSLVSVGGDFMSFQWDALLLETGFLAIFFAPGGWLPQCRGATSPSGSLLFLLRWLLFRLMVQSALVKWLSGDPLWRHLTALTVHYQTQPLPNPLSWYVHQFPMTFHKISCVLMFVIEGIVPFFIFTPRRLRLPAFWFLAGFQTLILLTGNYAYFNGLTVVLCLLLLDDSALRTCVPSWFDEPLALAAEGNFSRVRRKGLRVLCIAVFGLTVVSFGHVFGIRWPRVIGLPALAMSPLRSFNSYGLFAVMTPTRPEIILEGSNDGKTWQSYEFKYKPGDLSRHSAQIAPFQPRLDWQMWFAALSDYRQNPWFLYFCGRLLRGERSVSDLLARNPFPDQPPAMLRATVYEYRFTTPVERRQSGNWWARDEKGLYCPVLSLRQNE